MQSGTDPTRLGEEGECRSETEWVGTSLRRSSNSVAAGTRPTHLSVPEGARDYNRGRSCPQVERFRKIALPRSSAGLYF